MANAFRSIFAPCYVITERRGNFRVTSTCDFNLGLKEQEKVLRDWMGIKKIK